MPDSFPAIFEHGVFRPLTPVSVPDQATVELSLVSAADPPWLDREAHALAESVTEPDISLDEVRRRLAILDGNLSDDVIADRGEY